MAYKIMGITSSPFYTNMMIYYLMCDTPADLPSTISDIGYGTTIGYGSRADIISDSSKYLWNGSQWVRQTTGQEIEISADDIVYDKTSSGMTATNVQDAIDELKDTDDTQDNALVELSGENANQQLEIDYAINTGAKNMLFCKYTAGETVTAYGRTFEVLSDGGIKISGASTSTNYADFYFIGTWGNTQTLLNESEESCIISFKCSDPLQTDNLYIRTVDRRTGSTANTATARLNQEAEFNFPVTAVLITIQPTVTLPENGITVYPMIRNAVIRNTTFEPYAPTNKELYEISQTKADKGTFDLTIAGSPLVASEYSYSCIVTGDIVTISVRIVLAAELAVNASRNLFFIPSPYYPPVACAGAGYADGKVRTFWINQYGTIKIRIDEAIPAGSNLNANFCYSYKNANWTTITPESVQSLNSPLLLNREDIAPLETDVIKETEEINEIEETE